MTRSEDIPQMMSLLHRLLSAIVIRELQVAAEGKLKGELIRRRHLAPDEEKRRRNAMRRQGHGGDQILHHLNQAIAFMAPPDGSEDVNLKSAGRMAAWHDPEYAGRRMAILASWWGDWFEENDA